MPTETIKSREFESLIAEMSKTTGVAQDDIQKVLGEIAARQMQMLAAEFSSTTGVNEKELVKIFESLGVSDVLSMSPLGVIKSNWRETVREALVGVML